MSNSEAFLVPKGHRFFNDIYFILTISIRKKIMAIKKGEKYNWDDIASSEELFSSIDNVILLIQALKKLSDSDWKEWINYFDKALGTKSHQAAD